MVSLVEPKTAHPWLVDIFASRQSFSVSACYCIPQCVRLIAVLGQIHFFVSVTGNFYSMVDHKSVRLFLCGETGHISTFMHRDHLVQVDDRAMTSSLAKSFRGQHLRPFVQLNDFSSGHPCLLLDFCHLVPQFAPPDDAFLYKRFVCFRASLLCCKDRYSTTSGMIYFDMILNKRPLRSKLSLPAPFGISCRVVTLTSTVQLSILGEQLLTERADDAVVVLSC